MANPVDFATVASIVGGLTSVAGTLIAFFQMRLQRTEAMNITEATRLEAALNSNEIRVLGDYLYNDLGKVSLADFSSDDRVMARVDAVIASAEAFLGKPEDVPEHAEEPPSTIREVEPPISEVFARVESEIRSGEVWNGLARLRREIEIRLREIASANNLIPDKFTGAGQVLRTLSRSGRVVPQAETNLRYAIDVCNRGIHGLDVDAAEAEEALHSAETGLQLLSTA
jgi:hypothetical protein